MADEDEDLAHLAGPELAEVDLSDETQDFRFLDKLTYVPLPSCASHR
jgi:tRNA-splicing endonuclease subunit Sen54